MTTYETILLDVDDKGIALLTFNRPRARNALNLAMVEETRRALDELSLRDDVAALIFTGAGGKAFLSGADIAELLDRKRSDAMARINSGLFRDIEQFSMPTIAAISGYALGGGCELALACDIRICGDGAKFGQPEVSLGIIPGAGATYRLPRVIGPGMARELIFTGRIIDAQDAMQIGLVNHLVPDEDVVTRAREIAEDIAKHSRWAVRFAKLALNTSQELSTDGGMALESTMQAVLFEDEEKMRRMNDFVEKRDARRKAKENR